MGQFWDVVFGPTTTFKCQENISMGFLGSFSIPKIICYGCHRVCEVTEQNGLSELDYSEQGA